jgi:hypothetical protein
LAIPDVSYRGSEVDMAHPLASYPRASYLHAAFIAYDPPIPDLLILSTITLPILGRPEYGLAEKAVLLWPQSTVVDSLGFGDFTIGPRADLFRRG